MYEYETRYWWTFEESFGRGLLLYTVTPFSDTVENNILTYLGSTTYNNAPIWSDSTLVGYIKQLFHLVYARHYHDYCFSTEDDDWTATEFAEQDTYFVSRFVTRIVETYDKYYSLLKFYATHKANLMNKIGSSSTGIAKFNDTPQNENDSFEGDDYVTNITQTEGITESDGMPLIERLKQIQDAYQNVLTDWAKEFDGLFLNGENITL